MFVLWAVLAVLCVIAGFVGCVLPLVPGPPLSYLGLFVVWAARGFDAHTFGTATGLVLLGATIAVIVLELLAPVLGARRYGSSKWGVWGSVVGMLLGVLWFPPFGMMAGTFLGAWIGERARGRTGKEASRAAWGTFLGTMLGLALKLAFCAVVAWFVVREVFA
jgi:uncharacterized protein YqgC (DUF456 family)